MKICRASSLSPAVDVTDTDPTRLNSELFRLILKHPEKGGQKSNILVEIDALVDRGASVLQSYALHAACFSGQTALIPDLLTRGADINGRDEEGLTPLMLAATRMDAHCNRMNPNPDLSCVAMLCAQGADKSIKSKKGQTALAMWRDHNRELARFAKSMGLPPNLVGGTPDIYNEQIVTMLKHTGKKKASSSAAAAKK